MSEPTTTTIFDIVHEAPAAPGISQLVVASVECLSWLDERTVAAS